jgi:glycosyltransferase involved in cell wall biosynthesis
VIYQVHGGALPQDFPGRNPLLAELLRATLYLPDAIVVLANAELRAFREFVPGQRVLALPNAVDCAAFGESAHRRPDPDATLRLVYIGRLAEEKGIFESLQGIKLALAQGVRAELVIAGGGPDEARLKQSADQLALGSQVSFVGPISGERKAALLARADASILASRAEGLPYALLESMAAGVPVIATRVGAIPDVVNDRVHGLLIARPDPRAIAQAILTLASDRALLERMGEACRIRIANGYAIERLAKDLSRLYAQVCDPNKRVHAART